MFQPVNHTTKVALIAPVKDGGGLLASDWPQYLGAGHDGTSTELIRCPDCKSCHVQYPAITRKNILPALVAQTAVLLGLMDHECYCEKCQFTWPMKRGIPVAKPERLASP